MLDDLLHLRHSCQSSVNRRPPFRILFKKTSDLAARLHLAPIICPQGVRRIWLLFHRKFINCLLKHCNLEARPIYGLKTAQISQNWKKTSKKNAQKLRKKLLETKKIARNTTSCEKVGEQLQGSSREKGEGGRDLGGYSIKLFSERLRPEVQSLTLKYTIFDKRYPFRVSSI